MKIRWNSPAERAKVLAEMGIAVDEATAAKIGDAPKLSWFDEEVKDGGTTAKRVDESSDDKE